MKRVLPWRKNPCLCCTTRLWQNGLISKIVGTKPMGLWCLLRCRLVRTKTSPTKTNWQKHFKREKNCGHSIQFCEQRPTPRHALGSSDWRPPASSGVRNQSSAATQRAKQNFLQQGLLRLHSLHFPSSIQDPIANVKRWLKACGVPKQVKHVGSSKRAMGKNLRLVSKVQTVRASVMSSFTKEATTTVSDSLALTFGRCKHSRLAMKHGKSKLSLKSTSCSWLLASNN